MNGFARIELPDFKATKNDFTYGFFGKNGGVSSGDYKSLNVSYQSQDNAVSIKENRRRIASQLSIECMDIQTVKQVHGKSCLVVEDLYDCAAQVPDADSLVTDRPLVPIAVMSADCVPILFSAEKSNGRPIIGAAHAGWGGALQGVVETTLEAIRHLGGDMSSVKACIGPAIQRKNYEVDAAFSIPFLEEDELAERYFSAGKHDDKLQFDLPGYVTGRLARCGVKFICDSGLDTYGLDQDFFSYRRAQHQGENDYGRQASAIMIK
jgi:YfiH family protein